MQINIFHISNDNTAVHTNTKFLHFMFLCSANLVPSVITELTSLADTVLVGLLSTQVLFSPNHLLCSRYYQSHIPGV